MFFFFNDTATTEIYTLSLHDALPILLSSRTSSLCRCGSSSRSPGTNGSVRESVVRPPKGDRVALARDRKSTRLNSSHANISYAVFCLKKKKKLSTASYSTHSWRKSA